MLQISLYVCVRFSILSGAKFRSLRRLWSEKRQYSTHTSRDKTNSCKLLNKNMNVFTSFNRFAVFRLTSLSCRRWSACAACWRRWCGRGTKLNDSKTTIHPATPFTPSSTSPVEHRFDFVVSKQFFESNKSCSGSIFIYRLSCTGLLFLSCL